MRFVGFITQLICLGAFLQSLVEVEMYDCSNGAGFCNYGTNYLRCFININDTQLIKVLLRNCSDDRSSFDTLSVYKDYISNEYGNLLVDFDLPTNIQNLYIRNNRDEDHIRITTSVQNNDLESIYCSEYIELETNTFFTNFTNLQHIYVRYFLSTEAPSFANLLSLTRLVVRVLSPVTHAFDDTIVSGSTNLIYVNLYDSSFNGITKGAFRGINKLTRLDISMNKLTFIEEGSFTELSSIRAIILRDNKLTSVPDNVFEGLTKLKELYIDNNPGFPINALLSARYVESLEIQYNEYETLDSFVFQQMDSLRYIYLSNPFICDCRLQWTSFLNQYGIYIDSSARCSEPYDFFQRPITTQQIYTNCSQTQTYQCFNKSNTCPSNLACHNTEISYKCACPIGDLLNTAGECKDIDECDEVTECQHSCVNTEGSFHCACREGYKLVSNGYDCEDVNECQTENGGCQFGCSNTVGSYQCYCANGHKLKNETHCEEGIECELIENSCIDMQESNSVCRRGYNLTISSPTCPTVTTLQICVNNNSNTTVPTITQQICEQENEFCKVSTPLVGVLLVINILLIMAIVALCIYIPWKSAKEKRKFGWTTNPNSQNDENIFLNPYSNLEDSVTSQLNAKPENQDNVGSPQEDPTYHMD